MDLIDYNAANVKAFTVKAVAQISHPNIDPQKSTICPQGIVGKLGPFTKIMFTTKISLVVTETLNAKLALDHYFRVEIQNIDMIYQQKI